MQLVRDLLDQLLLDAAGEPAGRADDFALTVAGDDVFVDSILSGGGIVADDLGLIGRACEGIARGVRRRALRRRVIPWSWVSEVAEHALTVAPPGLPTATAGTRAGHAVRLRALRRMAARTADGTRLHLVDLQVDAVEPAARMRVTGFIFRPRHRCAWPVSLRPRPRGPGRDWRLVPPASVHVAATELVVDLVHGSLAQMTVSDVAPPPGRIPRADA